MRVTVFHQLLGLLRLFDIAVHDHKGIEQTRPLGANRECLKMHQNRTTHLPHSTPQGSSGSLRFAMRFWLWSRFFSRKRKTMMENPIDKQRLLRVMSLGGIAEMVLNPDISLMEQFNASAMLRHRLREFNGAMWVGAPLHERNAVINALRMTA